MRDYPWLERPISWLQFETFLSALDRRALANAWRQELKLEVRRSRSTRSVDPVPGWVESVPDSVRDSLDEGWFRDWCATAIGGRTPEEALLEFLREVRKFEIAVAEVLSSREESWHQASVSAREAGAVAARRVAGSHASPSEDSPPHTLSPFALILQQSAMGWLDWRSQGHPLVERDTPAVLDWIPWECPHRDPLVEKRAVADLLCRMHHEWLDGYLHAVRPTLQLESLPPEPAQGRCRFRIRWNGAARR